MRISDWSSDVCASDRQGLKNMFPQDGNFNVSAYKKLENEWADWIDTGMDVHITVELAPRQIDRPEQVRVAYEVTDPDDGRVVYDQRCTFRKQTGQSVDHTGTASGRERGGQKRE